MKLKLLFTIIISICTLSLVQAHALWLETQAIGKLNQKHSVKIFYGEYAEQTVDSVKNWYSNVKDFELYLIGPQGQKQKLEKSEKADHFEASFIPTENGTYTLSAIIPAKEAYETMRFEFSAFANVQVGNTALKNGTLPFHLQTDELNPKSGSIIQVQLLNQDQIEKDQEVIIMAPNGWTKTLKSDANGKINFKPIASGKYIIEASKTEDKKELWEGQNIEKIWKGTTLTLFVK